MRERPEAPSIRFTCRELLRQGGIAALALGGLPALLEACSSSSSPTPAGGSSGSSTADISGTTLDFYSWQGYDIPVKPIKEWLKSNDVTIKASYINTHDDITAKFTTGGGRGNYNLSTYEAGWGPLYIQLGIPTVLDVSKVPNFQKAYDVFKTGTEQALRDMADTTGGVVLGRAGAVVLAQHPTALHVRLDGPRQARVVQVAA